MLRQKQVKAEALDKLTEYTEATLFPIIGPEDGAKALKAIDDFRTNKLESEKKILESMLNRIGGVKAMPTEEKRADWYNAIVQDYVEKGLIDPKKIKPYSPEVLDAYERELMTANERYEADNPKPQSVSPGNSLVVAKPGQKPETVYTAPPAPEKAPAVGSFEDYVTHKYGPRPTPEQIEKARKDFGEAGRRDVSVNVGGMGALYGAVDPKAIADAIVRGEQPPMISELGRPVGAAVSSHLAKAGYNLATARQDWDATRRHFQTLNGSQQTRIRQAVDSSDSRRGRMQRSRNCARLPSRHPPSSRASGVRSSMTS